MSDLRNHQLWTLRAAAAILFLHVGMCVLPDFSETLWWLHSDIGFRTEWEREHGPEQEQWNWERPCIRKVELQFSFLGERMFALAIISLAGAAANIHLVSSTFWLIRTKSYSSSKRRVGLAVLAIACWCTTVVWQELKYYEMYAAAGLKTGSIDFQFSAIDEVHPVHSPAAVRAPFPIRFAGHVGPPGQGCCCWRRAA